MGIEESPPEGVQNGGIESKLDIPGISPSMGDNGRNYIVKEQLVSSVKIIDAFWLLINRL